MKDKLKKGYNSSMMHFELLSYKNMKFDVSPCGSKSHDGVSLLFPISLALKTAEKLLTVLFRSSTFTSSPY